MRLPSSAQVLLLALQVLVCESAPNCPFIGPAFPKPTALASSTSFQAALANLTTTFTARDLDPDTNPNSTSYSLEIFAAYNDKPIWSWYHTAPELIAANTSGVKTVDSNTVYRLGSVTKIFTIYTFLVEAGDVHWNEPVTSFVPELKSMADKAADDPVMNVDWGSITLGGLASQMAGITRDYGILGELTQEVTEGNLTLLGFPPVPDSDIPTCGEWPLCNRTEFFDGLSKVPPSFAPWQTPAYSDVAFQILAYALESIVGKDYDNMLQDDILSKLGLNHTYYQKPPDSVGAVPNGTKTTWSYSLGDGSPAGNMYSSVGDLSTLGRAIFKNTLLTGPQTRRWLKPVVMTSELVAGVGYPWGLRRVPLGTGNDAHRVVDTYNKAGRVGSYASLLVMIPDYDMGITALIAGNSIPANHNWNIADAVGGILLPALEAAAREQAQSINGTDMKAVATYYNLQYLPNNPSVRLYPTGLETKNSDGTTKIAFKAAYEDLDAPTRSNSMFSTDCGTWVSQTAAVYVNLPLDQFVFTLDKSGRVVSVEPLALRVSLKKTT
ncbi:putative beta-lactamase family protein [Phaeoacremonium minimum UCRPA7]|uniref:Putative beta-lactamase family protein n=1 Tax=Phaeoacremonium minimum (strain UCR-PA7) TaxID=1286976 RepID=R8B9I7_PHAM7|nr:putative beta-lactamase family protein [Phaeoacremonium minimum UCRPA7]EON95975.1 putative beta-lactamase family protein [Phaeoacremonium minimum UCRPA7]